MNDTKRRKIDLELGYIRTTYGVPAKIDGRVEYRWRPGSIVGAKGEYLRIRLDGESEIKLYHPTWKIKYL
jgi:hypothetical protein